MKGKKIQKLFRDKDHIIKNVWKINNKLIEVFGENTIILLRILHLLCSSVQHNVTRRCKMDKRFEKLINGVPLAH